MPSAGTAYIDFQGDFTTLQKQISTLAPALGSSFSGKFGKAAVGIGAVTAAAVGAGKALYDIGEQFDNAYDTIRSRTGATGKELAKLQSSFKKTIGAVPVDFDTAAEAVSGLNQRLELTGRPLTKLSRQFSALSKVTGEDVGSSVREVARAFEDWEIPVRRQSKILDQFFVLSQRTGIGVSDLASEVVQFGAPLRSFGFSVREAAAMLASFEESGVNMTTVMSAIRLGIGNIAKPTDELTALLKNLGVATAEPKDQFLAIADAIAEAKTEQDALGIAVTAFGKRGANDMKEAIRQGRFELDELVKSMGHSEGAIRKNERANRDLSEWVTILGNRLKTTLEPAATAVFKAMADGMRAITQAFSGRGPIARFFDDIEEFVRRSPVLQLIGDIGGKVLGGLKTAFQGIKEFIKGAVDIIGGILTLDFGRVWDGIGHIFKAGLNSVVAIFQTLTAPIRTVVEKIAKAISGPLSSLWEGIKSVWRDGVDFILGMVSTVTDGIAKWADLMSKLPGPIGDAFDEVQTGAEEASDAINRLRERLRGGDDTAQNLRGKWKNVWEGIANDADKNATDAWRYWRDFGIKLNSGQGTGAVRTFRTSVVRNFDRLANASIDAIADLASETKTTLAKLKVKGAGEIYVAHRRGSSNGGDGGTLAQKGAIVPGRGVGDRVPLHIDGRLAAMVEPGELVSVANRNATGALMAVNSMIPRFAEGGRLGDMKAMVRQASAINAAHRPYQWGGGHGGSWAANQAFDCSGAVSNVLHAGNLLSSPMVSGALARWGQPGRGPLTVFANAAHTFMRLNGRYFGTSSSNPGGGAGWIDGGYSKGYLSGFAARTMPALGMVAQLGRYLLSGPPGPLRSLGQAMIDKARAGMLAYLKKATPGGGFGGGQALRDFGKPKTVGTSDYGGPLDPTSGTVGSSGASLPGKMAFAELGMGTLLGGLPYDTKALIQYKGRSVVGTKLDIGGGGPPVQGHTRALDLWYQTAKRIGFPYPGVGLTRFAANRQRGGVLLRLADGGVVGPPGQVGTPQTGVGGGSAPPPGFSPWRPIPSGGAERGHGGENPVIPLTEWIQHLRRPGNPLGWMREIIKGVNLSKPRMDGIRSKWSESLDYDDWAANASMWDYEGWLMNPDGSFAYDADGEPIPHTYYGIYMGLPAIQRPGDAGGWLNKELAALLTLRDRLLAAIPIVKRLGDFIGKLAKQAKSVQSRVNRQFSAVKRLLGELRRRLKNLKERLRELQQIAHPTPAQKRRIEDLKRLIGQKQTQIEQTEAEVGKVKLQKDRLPTLAESLKSHQTGVLVPLYRALTTEGGDDFPSLEELQGRGSPTGPIFGGLIGQIQNEIWSALKADELPPPSKDMSGGDEGGGDTGGGETGTTDSQLADLLAQQLAATQQQLLVLEAQMPVFQDFFRSAPRFHTGGIVPGEGERWARVQGGEGVFTPEQMAALSTATSVTLIIEDGAVNEKKIKRVAADGTREAISAARRMGGGRVG